MHAMGDNDDEYMRTKDGKTVKVGIKGGDTTDYLYDEFTYAQTAESRTLIATTDVQHLTTSISSLDGEGGFGYRYHYQKQALQSPALYDPSFDVMSSYVGGAVTGKAIGLGLGYLSTSNKVGQLAFNSKYIGGTSKFFGRYKLGGHQGYLNRNPNWRIGWSWNNAAKTHQFMIRTGGKWNSVHGSSWFNYKP